MRSLFNPDSIAVIGASADPRKVGNIIISNLLASEYKGRIYPVNPKEKEIMGLPVHPSMEGLKDKVELAIFAIPARYVVDSMESAGEAGVKSAIIISAGFREEGPEGLARERELERVRERYGMRVVGPNCFGVMNTYSGMNATFTRRYPSPGNISLSSQSGAVGTSVLDWAILNKIGISKFVSLGNKMDVDESAVLEYLEGDDDTEVMAMYVESIRDGRRFMRAAKSFTDRKPLVVLKAGRTGQGAKAASSHTGALSGSDSIYDAAFRKVNAVRVKDMDELSDTMMMFSSMPSMVKDGVAVLTNAGGLGVMAADSCVDHALALADLSPNTRNRLLSEIPSLASNSNPVDIRGDARASDFARSIKVLSEDAHVNGMVIMLSPVDTVDLEVVAAIVIESSKGINIPLAVCLVGGEGCLSPAENLLRNGIPVFPIPDRAVRAMSHTLSYTERKGRENGPMIEPSIPDRKTCRSILDRVRGDGRLSLTEGEGKGILTSYGIPVPPEGDARCQSEAVALAEKIGFPVVMKVISPDIHHKTDVGGVAVGISSAEEASDAYGVIMERCRRAVPEARLDGVSVQKQVDGAEVIVSMIRDEQFGPVLSFGAGGIFVEVMKEISQAIVPLTEDELDRMLRSTRVYQLLTGARGRPAADVPALKDLMRRLVCLAEENDDIMELEINPVMVGEKDEGCWAVDALVTLGGIK